MQDEEIDKLITDAASQHHPPYDDKAWGKMEELLNQHLPQKKDRRRYVFLILLFLMLGGAIGTAILQLWKSNSTITLTKDKNQPAIVAQLKPGINESNTVLQPQPADNTVTVQSPDQKNGIITLTNTGNSRTLATITNLRNGTNDEQQVAANKSIRYNQKGKTTLLIKNPSVEYDTDVLTATSAKTITKESGNLDDDNPETTAENNTSNKPVNTAAAKQQTNAVTHTDSANTSALNEQATEKVKNKPVITKDKKKTDKSFANNFALTFSTGADVSYIELSNTGKMEVFYGTGISYTLNKHFRISSGIYVNKKVYTASPYQYKFPGGASYANLQSINADCKVYEIPLSLYYNFDAAKKHNWFAGMGISSLLMKRETYDYLYQTPGGQAYSYAKTINNENKHYFSVLTLSGGYQYNLSSRFSLIGEPYLKLPLSGVGAGKIKLNSTGFLFTAVIKPFGKVKK